MFAKLAMLGLMLVCVAYGGGLKHYETCLLAIPYGPGIMITVRLDNPSKYSSGVDMERYAGDGTLLATTEATVNGKSFNDVKLDNSAPKEDWGWIRVLATGKKPISVSYKVEWIHGDVLRSIDMQSGTHRHPLSDGAVQSAVVAGIHHKWTLDLAQLPGIKAYFFVNLSAYPVRLGMCQSDYPDCGTTDLPYTVAPNTQIWFPLGPQQFGVIESSPGYSAVTGLHFVPGNTKKFNVDSSITFGKPQ